MAYIQNNSPFLKVRKTTKGKGRNFLSTEEGAGMTEAGVKKYKKENPGSKLQTAVTKKPSELKAGSKDAKRRKSFCARMSGMPGPMKKQMEKMKPVKESLEESRKAEIVKEIMKKGKKKEDNSFEAEPVIGSTVVKADN